MGGRKKTNVTVAGIVAFILTYFERPAGTKEMQAGRIGTLKRIGILRGGNWVERNMRSAI